MFNLRDKYEGKKVFITGITGFKGSWLALLLNELGADVYGIGLLQEDIRSIFCVGDVADKAVVYYGDIRNLEQNTIPYMTLLECDYVFHLAAQPLVGYGYKHPLETLSVNLIGTVVIQEVLRNTTHPITYLNITTDKVYAPSTHSHIEDDVLHGEDPYSLSKSFSDMVTGLYARHYFPEAGVKAIRVRAGNVIGGGDYGDNRIMTDIVKSVTDNTPIHLRNPNATRPYQYVLDCLVQYLIIAAYGKEDSYNVGPLEATAVTTLELVNSCNRVGYDIEVFTDGQSIGEENKLLQLDVSRMLNEFGITPLAETIDDVTERALLWYNSNTEADSRDLVNEVIESQMKEVISHYEKTGEN